MSVGTFVVDLVLDAVVDGRLMRATRPIRVIAALLVGLVGINAAVFHLGRPLYAFRALIGLRTSWLSREILAFGLFAFFAAAYAAEVLLEHAGLVSDTGLALHLAAAACGVLGVLCSVMIYVDTRRPFWSLPLTGIKFTLTGLVLGLPAALLVSLLGAAAARQPRTVRPKCAMTAGTDSASSHAAPSSETTSAAGRPRTSPVRANLVAVSGRPQNGRRVST
ncbi:MAG TPA: DmsC/YnfH family molybdoenzyme membrane anchor subunit [Isosphaeraceae bacterium]